ncbi:MAG: hypothetical protein Q4A08_07900 [Bacteroidales bacterium]|nr:hypothetical protein [Bacteroidales bacterium]
MKKQYTTPQLKVVNVNSSAIICASAGFGDGTTDTMHAKEYDDFSDEGDNLLDFWDE